MGPPFGGISLSEGKKEEKPQEKSNENHRAFYSFPFNSRMWRLISQRSREQEGCCTPSERGQNRST